MATIGLGNGVNLQPSYYNNGHVNFGWDLMKEQLLIQTVRIEIEPERTALAAGWISAAQATGFAVIATYHKKAAIGSNNVNDLLAAANWWKVNYAVLGTDFTVHLMNEWGNHDLTADEYSDGYNQAIEIVREVYDGPIIIDLPGWGQGAHKAVDAIPSITDTNIVLSMKIYIASYDAGGGHSLEPADLDYLATAGLPCLVAEFGPVDDTQKDGHCDWAACVDHARELGWTVLGWCWNGDGHGFNMVSPAWSDVPTAQTFTQSDYFDNIYAHLNNNTI